MTVNNELTQRKMKYRSNCKSLKLFCAENLLGREIMWKGCGYRIMVFGGGLIETATFIEYLHSIFIQHYSYYR